MAAPIEVQKLVEKFAADEARFQNSNYNEEQVRVEFINPLFEALGWEVRNSLQVVHEDRVSVIEGNKKKVKHPDYGFRVGRDVKFYVEAKKPAVKLRSDPEPAYQLRRYGWSKKLNISVLTDFEELIIYNCTIEPNIKDKALKASVKVFTFKQYLDKWDEIAGLLSFEAVQNGAIETFAQDELPKGTATVDKAFLSEMEDWRMTLAQDIALHNPGLTRRDLNIAVQRTIDRIVFLRICEDRNIEPYSRLYNNASERNQVYDNLKTIYAEAHDKYNSGLFDFSAEGDKVSLDIHISDEPLQSIIKRLYYPVSPYEFSVLPSDILGQVYERFLGRVIELSEGGQASIEEKPEVRKAGGVYYTPTYIVDYIVENTVGKLLEGKDAAQVAKLNILDPACGSGSFLIGAYQYLMDWHVEFYTARIAENENSTFKSRLRESGNPIQPFALNTEEKKRILTNNIYGVDLDQQAVEVTKLSLLLKMLEDETDASARQFTLFATGERILPDLSDNIKWGNSLIGSDFYDNDKLEQLSLLDEAKANEEVFRVKVFDWEVEFDSIMSAGGFDAVIGNPPYRKERDSKDLLKDLIQSSYGKKYYQGKMDLWYFFLHRAIDVARTDALISFIVPSYWLKSAGASTLISRMSTELCFVDVVDFWKNKIFKDVSGLHMIFVSRKTNTNAIFRYRKFLKKGLDAFEIEDKLYTNSNSDTIIGSQVNESVIYTTDNKINFELSKFSGLLETLSKDTFLLEGKNKVFDVSQGIVEATDVVTQKAADATENPHLAGNGIFVLNETEYKNLNVTVQEDEYIKPYLRLADVVRFGYQYNNYTVFYIGNKDNEYIQNNPQLFPNIIQHLDKYSEFITSSNKPYGIHRTRKSHYFVQPKLVCPNMFDKPNFVYVEEEIYVNLAFNVVVTHQNKYSLKYLLGVLNSTLGAKWFDIFGKKRGVNNDVGVKVMRQFPIRTIDFDNPDEKAQHDSMVALVEAMLDLHKQLPGLSGQQKVVIEQKIASTDRKIDALVYDLYGLSKEEIAIVEGQ